MLTSLKQAAGEEPPRPYSLLAALSVLMSLLWDSGKSFTVNHCDW